MQSDCIFCKIAAKEIPVQSVYEDDQVIAFPDINPVAPAHVLLIPKRHIANILEFPANDPLPGHIMSIIPKIARQLGIDEEGFRVVINTKDNGGQTVHHMHCHIIGGRFMTWPPG